MKTIKLTLALFVAMLLATTTLTTSFADSYGSYSVDSDKEYSLEEMLTFAIEDEYVARAEYEKIINYYGNIKPFTNIIKAEVKHINSLKYIFESYDYDIPKDLSKEHVVLPSSIKEALEAGVAAEINNINMYKLFLEQDLPQDVERVFTNLMKASENHLSAYERRLDRY